MISFSEAIKSRDAAIKKLNAIKPTEAGEGATELTTDKVGIKYGFYKPSSQGQERHIIAKIYDKNLKNRGHRSRSLIAKQVQSIPLDQIRTDQHTISKNVLRQKLRGNWKDHSPKLPAFVQKKDGTYHLLDGNHRVAARKLRGFTHIRGTVDKE